MSDQPQKPRGRPKAMEPCVTVSAHIPLRHAQMMERMAAQAHRPTSVSAVIRQVIDKGLSKSNG